MYLGTHPNAFIQTCAWEMSNSFNLNADELDAFQFPEESGVIASLYPYVQVEMVTDAVSDILHECPGFAITFPITPSHCLDDLRCRAHPSEITTTGDHPELGSIIKIQNQFWVFHG